MSVDKLPELICPRCRQPLNQVRTAHGVFWGCPNCGGRAVNIELLRRTFTTESINPLWLHAIRNEGKSGCACPSCKNPMIEVALSDQADVNVDVCRSCHFIWFDGREVENLVPRPVPPAPPEVPQKVREIIAIERVKQLAEEARGPDFDSVAPDERWKWIAAFLGMPVEFDAAPQERRPWATWILCATIVAASTVAFARLHEIVAQLGLIPAQATRLHGLTFLTSFFLHAGVIHLIGNMYFLFVFGDDVENFLKPFRYLVLVALAAFVGDIAHIIVDPRSTIPCVGASRRHCRCHRVLRAEISSRQTGISHALGFCLVSMDSTAGVVCFCSLDIFPNHRSVGAEGWHQLRFVLCAFGRRVDWFRRLADVARSGRRTSIAFVPVRQENHLSFVTGRLFFPPRRQRVVMICAPDSASRSQFSE